MGRVSEFQALMRDSLTSTTVTVIPGHICAITLHVGPPTYPAPIQQIRFISNICQTETRACENTIKHEGLDKPIRSVNKLYNRNPWMEKFIVFCFCFLEQGRRGVVTFRPTGLRCIDIATNELIRLIFLTTNGMNWFTNPLPHADQPGL